VALNLLFPLDQFLLRAGRSLPPVVQVAGEEVPEPYRTLLVGDHDMTPTLEAFHRDRVNLRVLEQQREGDAYRRLVVLTLGASGRPIEFGAIVIDLGCFSPPTRDLVLGGDRPLGSILASERIQHASRPSAFIRVRSDAFINDALGLTGTADLYGRRNRLMLPDDRILADIIEILPSMA
jgi:chorismate-pyruvate lyase